MRLDPQKTIVLLIICGLAPCLSSAQQGRKSASPRPISRTSQDPVGYGPSSGHARTLTQDDGLAVIAAALDSRTHLNREPDCSHLVHAIYSRAGFPFSYTPSSNLYTGTREFQRVSHPQAGDLVVWEGHAGIVVNPARHVFFSALSSGFGTDAYDAPYWKNRGHLRFYRYIKGSFASARK
jgi:hypothetical protein